MRKVRIKPSKSTSILAMIVGLIMTGAGITLIIPIFGSFGVLWTLVAVGITVYHAFNAFSSSGLATEVIEVDDSSDSHIAQNDLANRLERLKSLRIDGLITEEEYQKKRSEIVSKL